jgi:hypothetical protein
MPLEPLLPLFHRLDREHFEARLGALADPPLSLRWSDGRMTRTAGLYRRAPGLCEIVLSRPLLVPLPREALLSTLCHEMIHAWVDRVQGVRESHGPGFRVSVRHRYPLPQRPAAWMARCPGCGTAVPCRRRRAGVACRSCCERHNGGVWDARFTLRFEPSPEGTVG